MAGAPSDARLRLTVPADMRGTRLDHALERLVPERSRSQLQKLVRRGGVRLDGRKVVRSNVQVQGGEALELHLDHRRRKRPQELTVLAEDDQRIVIDKPAGLLMHPNETGEHPTVSDLAVARFGPLPSISEAIRPGIVHRLDRETSGVSVLARTSEALDALRNQFRARTVAKCYHALVHGVPEEDGFEVDEPLGALPGHKDRQRVDAAGRAAKTSVQVVRRFERHALLACRPETGRRHQIRVHLAHRGLPIVGDKLYRREGWSEARLHRHFLHAVELAFDHPSTGARERFEASLPADLANVLEALAEGRATDVTNGSPAS